MVVESPLVVGALDSLGRDGELVAGGIAESLVVDAGLEDSLPADVAVAAVAAPPAPGSAVSDFAHPVNIRPTTAAAAPSAPAQWTPPAVRRCSSCRSCDLLGVYRSTGRPARYSSIVRYRHRPAAHRFGPHPQADSSAGTRRGWTGGSTVHRGERRPAAIRGLQPQLICVNGHRRGRHVPVGEVDRRRSRGQSQSMPSQSPGRLGAEQVREPGCLFRHRGRARHGLVDPQPGRRSVARRRWRTAR